MNTSVRVGVIVVMMFAVLGVPHRADVAPDRQDVVPPKPTGAQEVEVVAVMVDQSTQQPTVLLQGKRDKRSVALAIGLAEATGIAVPLQGVTPPRPLTHDLFLTLFGRLKVRSEEHTSELQSRPHLVCRLLLEKKKKTHTNTAHAVMCCSSI